MQVIFFVWKCIWEIRTDNPSLALKILNGTPRPILPSQKAWLKWPVIIIHENWLYTYDMYMYIVYVYV